jgi:sterol desaturase/sphingolipid hydroxylase (fatty acid hydroxylase superfamily)
MTDWLLEHQAAFQFYLWLGVFGVVALWESFGPRRALGTSAVARWSRNLAMAGLDALIARVALPLTAIALAAWSAQHGWGLLNQLSVPFWLAIAVSVAAMDLANYAVHRLFHTVPLLWRCHKIHHSDLDVDCTTALRHHPIEYLLVAGTMLTFIALVGASPVAVLIAATVDLCAAAFNHGNVAIPEAIDRRLRRFMVTPDMHRIHHSALVAEGNRNFGNVFPWWDRLFATYQPAPGIDHKRMDLGLDEARAPEDVTLLKLLALPFRSTRIAASA